MTKTLLTILGCLSLLSCGAVPSITDSALTDLKAQISANQQKQEELRETLNELALAQVEANENIKSELMKTQELLSTNFSSNRVATKNTAATQKQTKAEWLEEEGKILVGGVEDISFTTEDLTYEARIDTGATSSSLDARDITRFERDGDRWVRFKLYVDDEHFSDVERPVVRWVRIYQSGTEEGERRPVVEMAYRFGEIEDTAEFTLTDRSHLEYPALVGRNIMTDRMIVDVSDSHIFSEK